MSEIAIAASGVGKQYRIGAAQVRHNTLRDSIAASAGQLWSSMKSLGNRSEPETFWALRDVSFELREGEVLGIIGPNGAGKSTLLKILSRITEPTTGEIAIRGRVGSLLEVGTGFHSELTGRENIFLNGAILGMTRDEIHRKFDEIVDFAEVDRFIDTPVKHYSSGMYLRLGFAVAAHLEPEILIVDEVLAVGDAEFQKKCLGKMSDIAHRGRTVVFVSHNLDAVKRLCSRCLLLENGSVTITGSSSEVTSRYMAGSLRSFPPGDWYDLSNIRRRGSGEACIVGMCYRGGGADGPGAHTGRPLDVILRVHGTSPITLRCASLMISDTNGHKLLHAEIASQGRSLEILPGHTDVRISITQLNLSAGQYVISCWLGRRVADEVPVDFIDAALTFEVLDPNPTSAFYEWAVGPVACDFDFEVVDHESEPVAGKDTAEDDTHA
jgi:lipopolysaccharide transport system ATP-binding protein